ncbi:hypothetical protein J437_LFUL009101 [Ladona fulva]|uniref:Queuosine 5'-phosphate N-glycosylase/hydrolase n=1 Tax=Ladona fulva TaxID=123851 RepID=A0A8K0K735_LADFU|nr:hypothetical protein J437_LFUL009101 [Ladona fulva]
MTPLNPRETGRFVSGVAKHVSILSDGIKRVAEEIVNITREKKVTLNSSAGPDNLLPKPTEETAVDFLFVSDVLNFCFWPDKDKPKWRVKWNGKSFTGYYALCAALRKAQEENIPITDPKYYSVISEEDLGRILRPEPNASQVPLLKERVAALRQAGTALIEKYGGTFNQCVKKANKSAEKLLSLIVKDFTSFCDEAEYQGKKVALYKRAQILVGDIWMLYGGKDVGEFHDIELLTAFADYRVPQVLVYFGAMKYTDSLMDTLSKDIQLTNGSPEEVEIRACTIRACELISEELKEMAKQDPTSPVLNDAEVDHFLWNYRRDYAEELEKIPFHKSRCIYY